jgi:hypothetical protein
LVHHIVELFHENRQSSIVELFHEIRQTKLLITCNAYNKHISLDVDLDLAELFHGIVELFHETRQPMILIACNSYN